MSGMNNEPTPTTDFVLRDTDELLGSVDLEGGVTSLVVIEARTPGDVTVALAFYPGPPFVDPHVEELPSYVARMTSEQAVPRICWAPPSLPAKCGRQRTIGRRRDRCRRPTGLARRCRGSRVVDDGAHPVNDDQPMRAAIMCVRVSSSEVTGLDCLADAFDAAQIVPCGPNCARTQIVSWFETGRVRVEFAGAQSAPSPAAQLWAADYRPTVECGLPVRFSPEPESFNEPQYRSGGSAAGRL